MARRKKRHLLLKFFGLLTVLLLLTATAIASFLYWRYGDTLRAMQKQAKVYVNTSDENTFKLSQTSVIYAADGTVISRLKGDRDTTYVESEDIPLAVKSAIVSIEDKKFYRHDGVDYLALLRAAKEVLENGRILSGRQYHYHAAGTKYVSDTG